MANSFFRFKQFTIEQEGCPMKVTTDSCLFGAWLCDYLKGEITPALDIGSGTGLLMLMLAQHFRGEFFGVEKDDQCWEQSMKNIKASPWPDQLHIHCGDIRDYSSGIMYRLIVSNPPFHEGQLAGPNDRKNQAHHSTALSFGELIEAVSKLLADQGQFAVMVPAYRSMEMTETGKRAGFYVQHRVQVRQSPGHQFFRTFLLFSKLKSVADENEICVTGSSGEYSPEFSRLLKPYYLNL